jgi:hypothetical protein
MFKKHVVSLLSAYCHGELSTSASRRVAAHLLRCPTCRDAYDDVRYGIELAGALPRAQAPDRIWDRIEAALEEREKRADRVRSRIHPSFSPLRMPLIVPAGVAVLLLVAYLSPRLRQNQSPAWEVVRLSGTPRLGAKALGEPKGRMMVGQWLVTDGRSRAKVKVADIGHVEVGPNTRIRLEATRKDEHRLALDRGAMEAVISAPPRLFLVETPSALAVDLGCAYRLEVDDHGDGLLRVSMGWVAFERGGRESVVPAGAACKTRKGSGPGTPYFEDAPAALRHALEEFDLGRDRRAALRTVLDLSRKQDTLTLWHLLARVDAGDRPAVLRRVKELAPLHVGLSVDSLLRLDPGAMKRLKAHLETHWIETWDVEPLLRMPEKDRIDKLRERMGLTRE